MSDGITICFEPTNLHKSNPRPLAKLLAKAGFKNLNGELENFHSLKLRKRTVRLEIAEPPVEFFAISSSISGQWGSISMETRTQHRNTLERLQTNGVSFLDLVVAAQQFFASDSLSDREAGEINDLQNGITKERDPPLLAHGVHADTIQFMIDSHAGNMKTWETRIGRVYGLSDFDRTDQF
jgi:hypothetical protein